MGPFPPPNTLVAGCRDPKRPSKVVYCWVLFLKFVLVGFWGRFGLNFGSFWGPFLDQFSHHQKSRLRECFLNGFREISRFVPWCWMLQNHAIYNGFELFLKSRSFPSDLRFDQKNVKNDHKNEAKIVPETTSK